MTINPGTAHALVTREDHTMIITMNRPERRNAMTTAMLIRMYDAMVEASSDANVRCIILTGASGHFSAGADLKVMAGDPGEPDSEVDVDDRKRLDPEIEWRGGLRLYRPTKPIIAAVEGVAIGAGTEILQATDIRIAAESARFGVTEARWSLYPDGGSAVRLPRQVPYTVAAEMLLTGMHITATEALRIGLVGRVVPDGEALDKAREVAALIGQNGPLAVEAIVRTLHETDGMREEDAFEYEFEYGLAVKRSDDAREGARAFAEKRPPEFRRR